MGQKGRVDCIKGGLVRQWDTAALSYGDEALAEAPLLMRRNWRTVRTRGMQFAALPRGLRLVTKLPVVDDMHLVGFVLWFCKHVDSPSRFVSDTGDDLTALLWSGFFCFIDPAS